MADIKFSENFSIQPEFVYSAQGYEQIFNDQDVKAKIDYFNIPILIDYTVIDGLSVQVGPQIGINLRAELEGESQETSKIFVKNIDFSTVVGMQYDIDDSFFIQGRYALGLSEVRVNSESKHSVFSISLGFFIDRPSQTIED